jgi:hypothetical protein
MAIAIVNLLLTCSMKCVLGVAFCDAHDGHGGGDGVGVDA